MNALDAITATTVATATTTAHSTTATHGVPDAFAATTFAAGAPPALPAAAATGDSSPFFAAITRGLDGVQADGRRAADALAALATDPGVATHDVILAMEQARVSLQLAVEVRQRIVDAAREITSMQI